MRDDLYVSSKSIVPIDEREIKKGVIDLDNPIIEVLHFEWNPYGFDLHPIRELPLKGNALQELQHYHLDREEDLSAEIQRRGIELGELMIKRAMKACKLHKDHIYAR